MAELTSKNTNTTLTVSMSSAAYYSSLAEASAKKAAESEEKAEEYAEKAGETASAAVQNVKDAETEALSEIETLKQDILDIDNNYTELAKDWANKMPDEEIADDDGTVDGVEYSAKYYALQAAETAEKALEDIGAAKDAAVTEIETAKAIYSLRYEEI